MQDQQVEPSETTKQNTQTEPQDTLSDEDLKVVTDNFSSSRVSFGIIVGIASSQKQIYSMFVTFVSGFLATPGLFSGC